MGNFCENLPLSFMPRIESTEIDVGNYASYLVAKGVDQCVEFPRVTKLGGIVEGFTLEIVKDQPVVAEHLTQKGRFAASRKTCY